MSLDTKYRPPIYDDMLGQEATIAILREFVRSGRGFHQSYLFCGGHGSGKTTLGRILARALLCEAPVGGNPCDTCISCKGLLENNTSMDFMEIDAATNSGKADIIKITDEIAYSTFSGKRRIYLFDEAHQLSKDALDALLKYLEDTFPGSEDRKLTCIFCTTEPEKMRATILSRCAPAFVVQPQKPLVIAQRLQEICHKEGIEAELEMLVLIVEITECHIRDAMKAVEGVSMLGPVNKANVTAYLHLDLNTAYIDLLQAIGTDLSAALVAVKSLMQRVSPTTCYGKLTEVAMLAYQVYLGDTISGPWSHPAIQGLGARREVLLGYAARFASRPGRPTSAMLLMDIAALHHGGGSVRSPNVVLQVMAAPMAAAPMAPVAQVFPVQRVIPVQPLAPQKVTPPDAKDPSGGTVSGRDSDWVVDQRLVNRRGEPAALVVQGSSRSPVMKMAEFTDLLGKHLVEMRARGRSP